MRIHSPGFFRKKTTYSTSEMAVVVLVVVDLVVRAVDGLSVEELRISATGAAGATAARTAAGTRGGCCCCPTITAGGCGSGGGGGGSRC